jgi:sRNA-binding protein
MQLLSCCRTARVQLVTSLPALTISLLHLHLLCVHAQAEAKKAAQEAEKQEQARAAVAAAAAAAAPADTPAEKKAKKKAKKVTRLFHFSII